MNTTADILSGAPIDPVLTGPVSQPVSPADAAIASGPMPTPDMSTQAPNIPPDQMTPPDVTDNSINPTIAPLAPAGSNRLVSRPWEKILAGALFGLSGVSQIRGRGGFGAGAAAGINAENQHTTQIQELGMQKQQLQFESVRAADSHILALAQAKQADLASQDMKLKIDAQAKAAEALNDILGIDKPAEVTADNSTDMHAKAAGTLPALAAQNNGTIPAVATTNSPAGVGKDANTHTINAYPTTPANLQQNSDGNRALVNYYRMTQGLSQVTDQEWKTGGGAAFGELQKNGLTTGNALLASVAAGQKKMVDQAKSALYVTPTVSKDSKENIAAEQNLTLQIQKFKQSPNYNPNDPQQSAVLGLMNQNLSLLQKGSEEMETESATQEANAAGLAEQKKKAADQPYVNAEHVFQSNLQQTGKLLDRQNADTVARNLKADELTNTEQKNLNADLKPITDLQQKLQMSAQGNQSATAAANITYAEQQIVAGGVKRMNQAELDGLTKSIGTGNRQLQTWIDKGFTGEMPKVTYGELNQILTAETASRQKLYQDNVTSINSNIRKSGTNPTTNQADTDFAKKYGAVIR